MPPEPLLPESEDGQAVQDDRPVYFRSIEVENVLCFKSRQTLDLTDTNGYPAQWTVILGDNGVGKTTLLRCLAGMEPIPDNFNANDSSPKFVAPLCLNRKVHISWRKSLGQNLATLRVSFMIGRFYDGKVKVPSNTPQLSLLLDCVSEIQTNASITRINKDYSSEFYNTVNLPNCYGYGANRRMEATSLTKSLESDSTASLFSENSTLLNAEEWLLQADYSIALSARSGTVNPKLERRYQLIIEILKELLPDVEDVRIVMAGENRSGAIAEFLTPYGWVPLSSLGLGYRTVIAWTVDLAARMLDRYPDSDDPLSEPAVVLVDEIDLHLHPKWQRTIMTFLGDRFKNTQFIVTAHSPLVVQAAQNANLVLLRREGDEVMIDNNPEIIKNWRVDQVLTSVFELPSALPIEIEALIERRRKLILKSKRTAKDERELKRLEEKIGTIPTAESYEDIHAMDIIRQAAKLLENR